MHPMIMNSQLGGATGAGTAYATYDSSREIEWQTQIANKMFPEYPCRSQAQSFYELRKALGIASSPFHSISITPRQYISDHFICAVDTEKIIEAGFTRLNSKASDLMSIRTKSAGATTIPANFASKMYIVLHSDNVLEIKELEVKCMSR